MMLLLEKQGREEITTSAEPRANGVLKDFSASCPLAFYSHNVCEDVILLSKDRGELKTGLASVIKTAYRTGQNVPLSTLPGSPFTNLGHA